MGRRHWSSIRPDSTKDTVIGNSAIFNHLLFFKIYTFVAKHPKAYLVWLFTDNSLTCPNTIPTLLVE